VSTAVATTYLQGIEVPQESINPAAFFALTRRHMTPEVSNKAFAGLGNTDQVPLRKSDILAEIRVRFTGTLTVTLGGGTAATTAAWPYNLLKACRFTANGQSNLINASGLHLKVREFIADPKLSDRGVSQSVGGVSVQNGTLSKASEKWGVGSSATAIAGAPTNYTVDLEWVIPVAENQMDLAGAIFLATTSTDVTCELQWGSAADLFVLTGAATAALAGTFTVTTKKFSIPVYNGQIVVPDLSLFHSMIDGQTTTPGNETRPAGQGIGKSLLRIVGSVWSSGAPLPVSDTNYSELYWRYGNNETPDDIPSGTVMRQINEASYNVDVGGVWGFFVHEFAAENAFRDAVDEGTTSDLRFGTVIPSAVGLTNPQVRYFTEVIFAAGQGA